MLLYENGGLDLPTSENDDVVLSDYLESLVHEESERACTSAILGMPK